MCKFISKNYVKCTDRESTGNVVYSTEPYMLMKIEYLINLIKSKFLILK